MKKIIGLVVILAVLVLGGYYGMGIITEHTVRKNVDIVNQSNGLFADITEYHRGWFKSQATLNWRLHVPERIVRGADGQPQTMPAQDYQMQMPLTIYHGPIIFADNGVKLGLGYAKTDLTLPQTYAEQFNNTFTGNSTKPKLDLSLLINYLNNSKVNMSIPEFKLIAKQGNSQFDWKGMSSTVNVTSSMDEVAGDLTIEGMSFVKDQVTATMGEISSEYNLHRTDSGLFLGDASVSFPSLLIQDKTQKLFELNDLDINTSSDIESGLFNSHFKSSLDKIVTQGKTYGPGNLEMAVRNLDAGALARINEQANKMQQGSDVEKQQALMAIMPEIPKLFSRGAEFEISEMTFTMPEGTVEGNLIITLPKGDNNNPVEMMQKVQGNGRLKVPGAVLKQIISQTVRQRLAAGSTQVTSTPDTTATDPNAPANTASTATPDMEQQVAAQTDQQINAMVQSGLLVQQSTDYVVEVSLNQGQLVVNGKPFNPAMMKF
ncbi:DUF945 family protein [Legionella sp. MW5194]|uniref:YdgA family protein n=1 Tax=Legionella sp. MW5194 TaxID=2662448 RepID=UPI00193D5081|nr:YdgA family protein [Legionella sp. MW5194]QRN02729.1 DUF945 family protein [Legionella sp. MW5194]